MQGPSELTSAEEVHRQMSAAERVSIPYLPCSCSLFVVAR
jgi:hypothetical protein